MAFNATAHRSPHSASSSAGQSTAHLSVNTTRCSASWCTHSPMQCLTTQRATLCAEVSMQS